MGIDIDERRAVALRKIIGATDAELRGQLHMTLAFDIGDIVCVDARLAMVAHLVIGNPTRAILSDLVMIDPRLIDRMLSGDCSPDAFRARAQFQLVMEELGIRFLSPPFHDRLGVDLGKARADDGHTISAAAILLGWGMEKLAQAAHADIDALKTAFRLERFPQSLRRKCLQALRSGGCSIIPQHKRGWRAIHRLVPSGAVR